MWRSNGPHIAATAPPRKPSTITKGGTVIEVMAGNVIADNKVVDIKYLRLIILASMPCKCLGLRL